MRAIPIATNIALRCRELIGVQNALESCTNSQIKKSTPNSDFSPVSSSSSNLKNLIRSSELLLFKLDDTLHEARAARDAMTVYLQFIKDCSSQAAAADSPLTPANFNPSNSPKYLKVTKP
jgi:hypothetical protein